MATKVLDSYALIAFFEDEPGADAVRNLITRAEDGSVKLIMSVVTLGDVWRSIARAATNDVADKYVRELEGMAIEIVDADWPITRQAAAFRCSTTLSYGDCFAAAIAKYRKAELVTGDKRFAPLEREIKIAWIGK